MSLPTVGADAISAALTQFDAELRNTPQWLNWQTRQSYLYAIAANGKLYPPKQIVSMATGVPVSSFSGGGETHKYLNARGFTIETTRLPTESETMAALHELLLFKHPNAVTPKEAYEELAKRFELPERLRFAEMENNNEVHWENRVRFARRKLVDADVIDGTEHGVWKLKVRLQRKVWVEKCHVEGKPARQAGEHALGKSLWSPQRSRSGGDNYQNMRRLQPGDLVIHLVDNEKIVGVSKVGDYARPFVGIEATDWADVDAYQIPLESFQACDPPLLRSAFLGAPDLIAELRRIRAKHKGLFYDSNLSLHEGAYLTPAPAELVDVLDRASISASGHPLPYLGKPGEHRHRLSAPEQTAYSHYAKVWTYAPGRNAEHWDEFYREGLVAIGWDNTGDLTQYASASEIAEKLRSEHKRETSSANDALACFEFANVMSPGDLIFAKRGRSRIVGYGTVLDDYSFESDRENYKHVRRVRWDARGDWTTDRVLALKTLTDISDDREMVSALRALVGLDTKQEEPEVAPVEERMPYSVDDALDQLFFDRDEFTDTVDIWRAKRNLIVQGPPGVGKTFVAKRLAYALMGFKDPSRVTMVQFHQSYSYEDFVQGYRPDQSGLVLKEGLFLEFSRRAARDRDSAYVFIIDEVNRGNLSRILGELMMLIESDKRSSAWSMPLTYSKTGEAQFFVPENLYILGLMNTADRSLAMVDYALRRRFAFWTIRPHIRHPKLRDKIVSQGVPNSVVDALLDQIERVNEKVTADASNLGPGYCIGHSYFCQDKPEGMDPIRWLTGVVRTEIAPLIYEYYVDDHGIASQLVGELESALKAK